MKRVIYDQKPQTVTVSDYTYNVINHDIFFFGTDYSPLNINKVLNLIVNNYSDKSDADFNIAFSKYHEFYDAVKGRKNDEEILQEVKKHFEKEFYRKQNLPVHGKRFRFTLTKKSVEKLVSINGIPKDKLIDLFEKPSENPEFEYKTVAKYLTRLFESYTKLPSSEREKILFAERYQMIEQVIKNKSKGLKTVINENTWLHVKPYKILYDAMKHQGKRIDTTCALLGHKSRDDLSEKVGESREQIRRYICLTNLVPELLEYMDEGKIALRPGVELSYLDEDCQRDIVDFIDENESFSSHAQAIRIISFIPNNRTGMYSVYRKTMLHNFSIQFINNAIYTFILFMKYQ